jgi:hypothetical protein
VVPVKVAFDQTAWSAVWNSIYYTVVAILRLDSPINIFNELTATFFPMLTVRESSGSSDSSLAHKKFMFFFENQWCYILLCNFLLLMFL